MLIEIQCTNATEFDAATGRSGLCGHRMMVDSSKIGGVVECPKCKQAVEVEPPKTKSKQAPTAAPSSPLPPAKKSSPARRRRQKPSPSSDSQRRRPSRKVKTPSGNPVPAKQRSRQTVDDLAKRDVMELDLADEQFASTLGSDGSNRCRKCGHPSHQGRCAQCGFVEPRFEKMHLPVEAIKPRLAGMQLWLSKTLSEGIPIGTLLLISHIVAGLGIAALLTLAILGLFGMAIGFGPGLLLLLMTLAGGLLYAGLAYKGYQFVSNPKARLAWFQKPLWNAVLTLSRWMDWEKYDQRLAGRKVIKVNDAGFADRDLPLLEGLQSAEVLDLQGTQITDKGLAYLYRIESLRCLVVRKTQVTPDAVFRLQQTFPKLWIWY